MKRYTIVHPLFLSFFSKSLYQDVAKNWKGICFLYLFLLTALCWIPGIIQLHLSISDFTKNEAPTIIEQIPNIKITKGKVSTEKPGLHTIKNPKNGDPLIIIDTTGKYTSLKGSKAVALLTETKFTFKKNKIETSSFNLEKIDNFSINRKAIYHYLSIFETWFAITSYVFLLIFSFIYRILQVLLFAVIGIIFTKILRTTLSYQVLIRLTVISITPALIFTTLLDLLNIPTLGGTSFIISMCYLFYAVKINSKPELAEAEIVEAEISENSNEEL